jgi:protein-tyrosine phosphatase
MGDEARILIVCTGNICRSPFIERLLQHQLDAPASGSRPGILVRSAGTGALEGSAMDPRAAAQLVAHGGDPSGFTARQITPAFIAEADLVLTATRAHRGKVALLWPKVLRRVFTFRDFADLVAGIDRADLVAGMNALSAPSTRGVTPPDPASWVRAVTEKAATRRGLRAPLVPDQADIVDPYRRDDGVFATMAQQIVESMPAVVRALGA